MGIVSEARKMGILIEECGEKMVLLEDFVLEPMYFKWGFSETDAIYLREGLVAKLKEAHELLPKGFDFKIWDGFRTLKTQEILYKDYWERLVKENPSWSDEQLREAVEVFVSPASRDPLFPAPHNTGGAVDLTLIDESGSEVLMGAEFDEFNEKSYTNHYGSGNFHENRMLLKEVLESVGFVNYEEEWWHFSFGDQAWAMAKGETFAIYGSVELGFEKSFPGEPFSGTFSPCKK